MLLLAAALAALFLVLAFLLILVLTGHGAIVTHGLALIFGGGQWIWNTVAEGLGEDGTNPEECDSPREAEAQASEYGQNVTQATGARLYYVSYTDALHVHDMYLL